MAITVIIFESKSRFVILKRQACLDMYFFPVTACILRQEDAQVGQ